MPTTFPALICFSLALANASPIPNLIRKELEPPADSALVRLEKKHPEFFSRKGLRFALKEEWRNGDSLFVAVLLERLRLRHGMSRSEGVPDTLKILEGGDLAFRSRVGSWKAEAVIPLRPTPPSEFDWEPTYYTFLVSRADYDDKGNKSPAVWDTRQFAKPGDGPAADFGIQIRWALEGGLRRAYEQPNFARLREIFQGKGNCILTGWVGKGGDEWKGTDTAYYRWETAEQYLSNLEAIHAKQGARFRPKLTVMKVYRDITGDYESRYWAIVQQDWTTLSKAGKVLYQDDGFLFVNFDFGESGRVSNFNIRYRLWFDHYKAAQAETGIPRWQRDSLDMAGLLDKQARMHGRLVKKVGDGLVPNPEERGLSDIDSIIVARMLEDLVAAQRMAYQPKPKSVGKKQGGGARLR